VVKKHKPTTTQEKQAKTRKQQQQRKIQQKRTQSQTRESRKLLKVMKLRVVRKKKKRKKRTNGRWVRRGITSCVKMEIGIRQMLVSGLLSEKQACFWNNLKKRRDYFCQHLYG
jgi:hypothetical protein